MRDYLALHHGDKFDRTFGKGTGKAIMHATAGRWVKLTAEGYMTTDIMQNG